MNTTIIYSNPCHDDLLKDYADAAEQKLRSSNELTDIFNLSELDLKSCTGCWSCWWKTPGKCAIKDGIEDIYSSVMKSGLVLFIAPLAMGTIHSELKIFIERMIPLVHPYLIISDGEVHHKKRYENYPDLAAVLAPEADTDDEDRELTEYYFRRLIKNFHCGLRFVSFTDTTNAEAVNELLAD